MKKAAIYFDMSASFGSSRCGSLVVRGVVEYRSGGLLSTAGEGSRNRMEAQCFGDCFFSYRLVLTKDIAAPALEAGNSPTMIFPHYRELATEAEATEWFGILPASEARNVVRMTA